MIYATKNPAPGYRIAAENRISQQNTQAGIELRARNLAQPPQKVHCNNLLCISLGCPNNRAWQPGIDSSNVELQHMHDRVVQGGVAIIDDYGTHICKRAEDEFIAGKSCFRPTDSLAQFATRRRKVLVT